MLRSLNSPHAYAGVYGFLLPGLGHLYLRMPFAAALWFAGFLAILLLPLPRILLLGLAVASAWDGYRRPPVGTGPGLRHFAFGAVGITAFLFWSLLLLPLLGPMDAQLSVERQAGRLAAKLRQCRDGQGGPPETVEGCVGPAGGRDPWGSPFRYERARTGKSGFLLRSAGPDGAWGSRDDYRFRYHW